MNYITTNFLFIKNSPPAFCACESCGVPYGTITNVQVCLSCFFLDFDDAKREANIKNLNTAFPEPNRRFMSERGGCPETISLLGFFSVLEDEYKKRTTRLNAPKILHPARTADYLFLSGKDEYLRIADRQYCVEGYAMGIAYAMYYAARGYDFDTFCASWQHCFPSRNANVSSLACKIAHVVAMYPYTFIDVWNFDLALAELVLYSAFSLYKNVFYGRGAYKPYYHECVLVDDDEPQFYQEAVQIDAVFVEIEKCYDDYENLVVEKESVGKMVDSFDTALPALTNACPLNRIVTNADLSIIQTVVREAFHHGFACEHKEKYLATSLIFPPSEDLFHAGETRGDIPLAFVSIHECLHVPDVEECHLNPVSSGRHHIIFLTMEKQESLTHAYMRYNFLPIYLKIPLCLVRHLQAVDQLKMLQSQLKIFDTDVWDLCCFCVDKKIFTIEVAAVQFGYNPGLRTPIAKRLCDDEWQYHRQTCYGDDVIDYWASDSYDSCDESDFYPWEIEEFEKSDDYYVHSIDVPPLEFCYDESSVSEVFSSSQDPYACYSNFQDTGGFYHLPDVGDGWDFDPDENDDGFDDEWWEDDLPGGQLGLFIDLARADFDSLSNSGDEWVFDK